MFPYANPDTTQVFGLGNHGLQATTNPTPTPANNGGGLTWLENTLQNIIPNLGDSAANVINAIKGNTATTNYILPEQKKADNTMLIIIAVIVFALIIMAMFIFKKQRG